MIWTILRIHLLAIRRDRVVQALTFALPILFFSVFALVFGQQGKSATGKVKVAVVDEGGSALNQRLIRGLEGEGGLRIVKETRPKDAPQETAPRPLNRGQAMDLVRRGAVPVALVFPKDLAVGFGSAGGARPKGPAVEVYYDASDPVAPQMVQGLLQKVVMTSAGDVMMDDGLKQFETFAGPLTPGQRSTVDRWLPELRRRLEKPAPESNTAPKGQSSNQDFSLVPLKMIDVLGESKTGGLIAFYAAGIGVMFLLFAASGASGALLDEIEAGTLERLLNSKLGMGRLLFGKWLAITLTGIVQLAVMFGWGALVFKLAWLPHFTGWLLMTSFTASAAAAFGLVLAALCRSRAQLGGLSTILILLMSALGGSMFPRFLMSETMQKLGLATFNGWALDGFLKVFWREAPLLDLWPQLLVLGLMTIAFMIGARLLARRWETI